MKLGSFINLLLDLGLYSIMQNDGSAYSTQLTENDILKLQFFFRSQGNKSIIKIIEYEAFKEYEGHVVYNLAFGDVDQISGEFLDKVNSNNGDMRKVFRTVLSTVPIFFKQHPQARISVQGSDSDESLGCAVPCAKSRCSERCKNIDRRINTYRSFIDKNFTELTQHYIIFGRDNEKRYVQYNKDEAYDAILVYKKN